MSCQRYDRALALHVEGDLPTAEAATLERHLGQCAHCRELLARLEASQDEVRSLRDEPLDDALLAEVRSRVIEAAAGIGAQGASSRWTWALAAAVAVVVTSFVLLRHPQPGPSLDALQGAASSASTSLPRPEPTSPVLSQSTARAPAAVSPRVGRKTMRRGSGLSPDDADQLARAIVAVSRVQRLSDSADTAERVTARPSDVVRLETANPDVVIYWQLDSSGG